MTCNVLSATGFFVSNISTPSWVFAESVPKMTRLEIGTTMPNDIYLSRVHTCRRCGVLYNVIRQGLAHCACNFPDDYSKEKEPENDET